MTEACAGAGTGTWIGNLGSQVVAVVKAKGKKHLLIHFPEQEVFNRSTSIMYANRSTSIMYATYHFKQNTNRIHMTAAYDTG